MQYLGSSLCTYQKSAEWHLSLRMSAIFCHYTVWYSGVILLKSQLGDIEANSTSLPKHFVNIQCLKMYVFWARQGSLRISVHITLSHEKYACGFSQHGMIACPNSCTVLHKSQWKNYQSRLILRQNRSETKNCYFNGSLCLKSCFTESIVTFWENPMLMMNHQQQEWQWGATEIVKILAHHVHCTVHIS